MSAVHAEVVNAEVPLIGRRDELSLIRGVLEARGGSRAVLITGDAGIGKSRLLAEVTRGCQDAGVVVLRGECLPLSEALPLLPIAEALRGLSARGGGVLFADVLAGQPAFVRPQLARLLPELGAVADEAVPAGFGDGWQRARLFTALHDVLVATASRHPVALLVEDLHWADRTTLDLLTLLVAGNTDERVRLGLTCRSDEPALRPEVRDWLTKTGATSGVVGINLPGLSRLESSEHVAALIGTRPDRHASDAWYRLSQGNPFFTEQLLASAFSDTGSGSAAAAPGIPSRLADMLTARTREISPVAQRVLAALAVAGQPVDEETLADVSGVAGESLYDALAELSGSALASRHTRGRYKARHALLAEAVAADLPSGRRRALHIRLAEALGAQDAERRAADVAAHWAMADRPEEELLWSSRAGHEAEHVHAFAEAARDWERVTQLWDAAPDKPAGLRLADAYLHAIDATHASGGSQRAL